jgi:hypothetical protein
MFISERASWSELLDDAAREDTIALKETPKMAKWP